MINFIKIISSLLFIPLISITLFSGILKYQLLNDTFLINTFEKNHTYLKLQSEINTYLDNKNANIFSKLVTIENIKDFTDKNISLVTKFANGNSNELNLYIPVSKIPSDMLPKKLGSLKENMSAKEIIQKFNINGFDPLIFDQMKLFGPIINYIFFIGLILTMLALINTFPLIILLVGVMVFMLQFFVPQIDFQNNKLLVLILNTLISEISKNLAIVGIILILIALLSVLLRKIQKEKKNG